MIELWTNADLGEANFHDFVAAKFQDTSKVDNIDAQIFYQQQQIRMDSARYLRLKAHSRIPKLIQLLKLRMQVEPGAADLNWQKFRLALTIQDMAMLKHEMQKHDDALLHLREAEDILR